MTQQTIDFQPAERLSLCDKLEAYLKARPNQWIDGRMFQNVAGTYGWRTRLSDLRKRGMVIQNRVKTCHNYYRRYKVSEYRYVPDGAREGSSSY
jgi:hypothetical protein